MEEQNLSDMEFIIVPEVCDFKAFWRENDDGMPDGNTNEMPDSTQGEVKPRNDDELPDIS